MATDTRRGIIGRIPLLGAAALTGYRAFRKRAGAKADRAALSALRNIGGPGEKIASAIEALDRPLPENERRTIEAIERARARLFDRHDLIVDGTLGPAGPFDEGVTAARACSVSKPARSARLLYTLIREFSPQQVLELGTNIGISAAYQAAALLANGDGGRLITLEASPYRVRMAESFHSALGLGNVTYVTGLFTDTLTQTVSDMSTVDFAFIDGHHEYEPTLAYFDAVRKFATPNTVFVFDDIRWSDGMIRAWDDLLADEGIGISVDLNSMGVCLAARDGVRHRSPSIRYALS